MVRMRSFEGFAGARPHKSAVTVHFVGPLGHGVGLAADILEHVAEAAAHAVVRQRRVSVGAQMMQRPQEGLLHVVRMEAAAPGHRLPDITDSTEIIVAWSVEAALAFAHLLKSPSDFFVLPEDGIPAWRRGMLLDPCRAQSNCGSEERLPGRDSERSRGVLAAMRALGIICRRLPFDDGLWQDVVAQHVPAALRDAALRHFTAAAW